MRAPPGCSHPSDVGTWARSSPRPRRRRYPRSTRRLLDGGGASLGCAAADHVHSQRDGQNQLRARRLSGGGDLNPERGHPSSPWLTHPADDLRGVCPCNPPGTTEPRQRHAGVVHRQRGSPADDEQDAEREEGSRSTCQGVRDQNDASGEPKQRGKDQGWPPGARRNPASSLFSRHPRDCARGSRPSRHIWERPHEQPEPVKRGLLG